jgi:TPR repeat protein
LFNEDQCVPRYVLQLRAFEDRRTDTNDTVHHTDVKTTSKDKTASLDTNAQASVQSIPKDPKEVEHKAMETKAHAGDAVAQCTLGTWYDSTMVAEPGILKDDKKAIQWYQLAVNQSHSMAQNNLGNMYLLGVGVVADLKKAAELFRLSANQNNDYGTANLGHCEENGYGMAMDVFNAKKLYNKAALLGNNWAKQQVARLETKQQQALASAGDVRAQFQLGIWHESAMQGEPGVPKDDKIAFQWYQLAAAQGHSMAQNNLGNQYLMGIGVKADLKKAHELFRQSAAQNNSYGLANLGHTYEHGYGCTKNLSLAHDLYIKAANMGNKWAQDRLARWK